MKHSLTFPNALNRREFNMSSYVLRSGDQEGSNNIRNVKFFQDLFQKTVT